MSKNFEFDLDDPLADLLSDDSANGFFDQNFKKKEAVKDTKKPDRSKLVSDLFGIDDEIDLEGTSLPIKKQPEIKTDSYTPGPSSLNAEENLTKTSNRFSAKSSFEDVGQYSNVAGKSDIFQNESILDDLFAPTLTKAKDKEPVVPAVEKIPESTKSSNPVNSDVTFGGYVPTLSNDRIRTRRKNSVANDPLGIFAKKASANEGEAGGETVPLVNVKKSEKANVERKRNNDDWLGIEKTTSRDNVEKKIQANEAGSDLPSWLGGGGASSREKSDVKSFQPAEHVDPVSNTENQPQKSLTILAPQIEKYDNPNPNIINESADISSVRALTVSYQENQLAAANVLRQHQSQLIMATHMRAQEEHMIALQNRQQAVLSQQEEHFKKLLDQQMQRQIELDNTLRIQQEKLNQHLMVLMAQPQPMLNSILMPNLLENRSSLNQKASGDNNMQTEKPIQQNDTPENDKEHLLLEQEKSRIEVEKLHLQEILDAIKEKHNNELDLMEESYKRQLSMVEKSRDDIETRLRSENEKMIEFYTAKLKLVENDNEWMIQKYETKIKSLHEEYQKDLERINEKHKTDLDNLRHEHEQMVMNFREAKLLESRLVKESSSHGETLKEATELLEKSCTDLTKINRGRERLEVQREEMLKNKEEELQVLQESLRKSHEKYESERVRMLDVVEKLQSQLSENNKILSEEQSTLLRRQQELESKERRLDLEKREFEEMRERETKKMHNLKKDFLSEQERMSTKWDEERKIIRAEKTRLQTMIRLQNLNDPKNNRAEIDAAINAAADATRLANMEKSKFSERRRALEKQFQELHEHQRILQIRSSELDNALDTTLSKQRLSEKVIQAARSAESDFKNKTQSLNNQIESIKQSEMAIEKEKQRLSRERAELMLEKKKLESKQCSLCKVGESIRERSNFQLRRHDNNFQSANSLQNDYSSDTRNLPNPGDMQRANFKSTLNLPGTSSYDTNRRPSLPNPTLELGIGVSDNILDDFRIRYLQNTLNVDTNFSNISGNINTNDDALHPSTVFSTRDLLNLDSDNWLLADFGMHETANLNIMKHLRLDPPIGDSGSPAGETKLEELYFNSTFDEIQSRPERLNISPREDSKDSK